MLAFSPTAGTASRSLTPIGKWPRYISSPKLLTHVLNPCAGDVPRILRKTVGPVSNKFGDIK